jgi:hypothetical protein
MAGKKFLNPVWKIAICVAGMLIMGYFLYSSIRSETFDDHLTILRALVFLGFTYLLAGSIKQMLQPPEK